ncbi:MAG TPA: GNAT family N-acetyltransferase [Candidatus Acidoferrum sp.]|nr:GNAT family N-acetyltransferase [Candidatus Acidoferrum sp.]
MANLVRVIHELRLDDDASIRSRLSRVIAYVPEETPEGSRYASVGYISASAYQAPTDAVTLGWLGVMYVHKAFRRQQFGRLMMGHLDFAPQWFCQAFTRGSLCLC